MGAPAAVEQVRKSKTQPTRFGAYNQVEESMRVFYLRRLFCRICENSVGPALIIAPDVDTAVRIFLETPGVLDFARGDGEYDCTSCGNDLTPDAGSMREIELNLLRSGMIDLRTMP